nr:MAG TPA: hypothetical protein [Bacteriophage sp.]
MLLRFCFLLFSRFIKKCKVKFFDLEIQAL